MHTLGDGQFVAHFPKGTKSVTLKHMWQSVDWTSSTERTWHATNDTAWTGCDADTTFVDNLVCKVGNAGGGGAAITEQKIAPKLWDDHFESVYFVGDSTMKRLFDAAVRRHCVAGSKTFSQYGKLHQSTMASYEKIHFFYIFMVRLTSSDSSSDQTSRVSKTYPSYSP